MSGTDDQQPDSGETRCGFVALVGAPNAGKSTLLNALVGEKVSIVTHKVQTTRFRLRGIAMAGPAQLVFVDTPGIFAPKRRLEEAMVQAAWEGASDADIVAVLIDVAPFAEAGERLVEHPRYGDAKDLIERVAATGRPAVLVLNKIDLVRRDRLLALAEAFNALADFRSTFMVSALTGDGTKAFLDWIATHVPAGPWLYPPDQAADIPLRLLAAEVTREQMMLSLHDELPYQSTVETDLWKELKDGSVRIEQTVYVARDSQKAIVVGKGGARLKQIGQAARTILEEALGGRAHLFIRVKTRDKWQDDPARYRAIGLDFPKPAS
ncbi:MAG: GTPase Era [Pseudomonadota bacterium]